MSSRASFVRDPEARRQALIDACASGLAVRGAAGVSVRSICADAGVSPGLLSHYFAGIDDLVAATYTHVAGQVTASLQAAVAAVGPDPHDRLQAYVVASFKPPIATAELLATWLAFWSLVTTNAAIARLHGEIYSAYRIDLETLLLATGMPAAETQMAAIAITALVDGLWLELSLGAGAFTPAEADSIARRWLDTWVPVRQTAALSRGIEWTRTLS